MAILISLGVIAVLAAWGYGCNLACAAREKRSSSSNPESIKQTSPADQEQKQTAA